MSPNSESVRVVPLWLWVLTAVMVAAPLSVEAFTTGAPPSTCGDMQPHHNAEAQTGPSLYSITVSRPSVAPGEPVDVTISSPGGFRFKGYLLQVRQVGSSEPLGKFADFNTSNAKAMDCLGGSGNAVTHSNPSEKSSATFTWQPPDGFSGSVVAIATVVSNYQTFWINVMERFQVGAVTHGISTTQVPYTTPITSTTAKFITTSSISTPHYSIEPIYNGCGVQKACLGDDGDCLKSGTCRMVVTVLVKGDTYEFEMRALRAAYVAVGLSSDGKMGDDSVVECVNNKTLNKVQIYQSWNTGKTNSRLHENKGVQLKNSSLEDGGVYCKFTRDKITSVNGITFDLENTKYFLLLAAGSSVSDDNINVHDGKAASARGSYLSDVNGFTTKSQILLRLHGAFMVGAWIGAASIGIVLARYFRQTWTSTKCCGKDHWFAWHRMLMMLVWCLTISAFVMIFVEIQEWTSEDNTHAILGVITTTLAFFQPIAAVFRPSPDARRRPIFNGIHWLVGNCAHILAIVTIFFAEKLSKALLPDWWIWVMVGYVAFHVIMHLVFSVAGCVSEQQSSRRINSFPMREMSNSRVPLASAERRQEAPYSCFRKFLLAVYIVGILAFTIAIIIIVVLAPIEKNFEHFRKSIYSNSSV